MSSEIKRISAKLILGTYMTSDRSHFLLTYTVINYRVRQHNNAEVNAPKYFLSCVNNMCADNISIVASWTFCSTTFEALHFITEVLVRVYCSFKGKTKLLCLSEHSGHSSQALQSTSFVLVCAYSNLCAHVHSYEHSN